MNSFEKSDVRSIQKQFKQLTQLNALQFNRFSIRKEKTDYNIYLHVEPEEVVLSLDDLDSLTPNILNLVSDDIVVSSYATNLNDWVYVENEENSLSWESPITELSVDIQPRSKYKSWKVSVPYVGSGNMYNFSPDSYQTALVNIILYVQNTNPYNVEYIVKLKEIAKEAFQELSGVGKTTASKLVERKNVLTFEELNRKPFFLDGTRYRDKAVEEVEELAGTERDTKNHPEIQELQQKISVENL